MVRVESTPSQTRLIINADDLGISRGVNIGIVEAAAAEVVTSASMIVNLPAFADALDRAVVCPTLSLGLHLNLTVGRPLTRAPSLTRHDTGEFFTLPVLVARASLGLLDSSDIARECLAQIDRMTDAGFPPTHLDSHRHVHAHPALFSVVTRAAASRGIFQVRIPRESLRVNARDWRATLKKTGLLICAGLSRGNVGADRAVDFVGVSLQGGKSFATRLFALIPQLRAGTTELMTHPGYADASLAEHDSYTLERVTELRALTSRDFRDLLVRSGVTLTSFGQRRSIVPREGEFAQHH
jgi:predicted glycoside hydrolase/deacetylase ChbG (UPF0249 family)